MSWSRYLVFGAVAWALLAGCESEAPAKRTPATGGHVVFSSHPTTKEAAPPRPFDVDPADSHVRFTVDAAEALLEGQLTRGVTGELLVDPGDLTRTSGSLRADLASLALSRRPRAPDGGVAQPVASSAALASAREVLELEPDAGLPSEWGEVGSDAYRYVDLTIESAEVLEGRDLRILSGDRRRAVLTLRGTLALHGREQPLSVEVEAEFRFRGGEPVSVAMKTIRPLEVPLAEFDVAFAERPPRPVAPSTGAESEDEPPRESTAALVTLEVGATFVTDDPPPPPAASAPSEGVASSAASARASSVASASASAVGSSAPSGTGAPSRDAGR